MVDACERVSAAARAVPAFGISLATPRPKSYFSAPRQLDDVRRRRPYQALDVPGPCIERSLALREILESVINLGHAGDLAARVVEDLVDHVRRDPQSRHAGCRRAAQIVQREGRHLFAQGCSHDCSDALPAAAETADRRVAAETGSKRPTLFAGDPRQPL